MQWKIIKNFENYSVSDTGLVKNNKTDKILKPSVDVWGYLRVDLCNNGSIKHKKIHKLVLETFIPNYNNLPQINHKDENKLNNNLNNLEWCDAKYNLNYGNRRKIASKHTSKKVIIREFNKIFDSIKECAKYLNICVRDLKNLNKRSKYIIERYIGEK